MVIAANRALSRSDVLLVVLAVVTGMAAWSIVESAIGWASEGFEPHAESYQNTKRVPLLQAELATAQEALAVVRKRFIEQTLEHQRDVATLQALGANDPHSRPAAILSLPLETLKAAAQARLEQQVGQRHVKSLEAEASALAAKASAAATKHDAASPVATESAGLSQTDRLAVVQRAIAEARLEHLKATARVDGIEAVYPALAQLPPEGAALLGLPADMQQAAAMAVNRIHASEWLVAALGNDLAVKSAEVAEKTTALDKSKREAEHELADARSAWEWRKRAVTLLISLLLMAVLGVLSWWAGRSIAAWGICRNPGKVLLLSVCALLILYGFQTARFSGAIVAGLLALLILFWLTAPAESVQETTRGTTSGSLTEATAHLKNQEESTA